MIVEKACWERGCACYDHRVDEGVEVTLAREWQGLTEAERIDIIDEEIITNQSTEHFALAQAIEAKLKEKNT